MNNSIEDKILAMVKSVNPSDPLEYVQGVVKGFALDKTKQNIMNCSKCDLCNFKVKTIPKGKHDAKILVIGESVSKQQFESDSNISFPMMDSDGESFSRALGVINANEDELYTINAVNCYPAKDNGAAINKRIPSVVERNMCKGYVDNIIDLIKPDVIITLGSVATNSISEERISIMTSRGAMFKYKNYDVMPTLHPGFFREMSEKFDEEIMNSYKDNFLVDIYNAFVLAKEKNTNSKIGNIQLPF